jgi:hypothetical protein
VANIGRTSVVVDVLTLFPHSGAGTLMPMQDNARRKSLMRRLNREKTLYAVVILQAPPVDARTADAAL